MKADGFFDPMCADKMNSRKDSGSMGTFFLLRGSMGTFFLLRKVNAAS